MYLSTKDRNTVDPVPAANREGKSGMHKFNDQRKGSTLHKNLTQLIQQSPKHEFGQLIQQKADHFISNPIQLKANATGLPDKLKSGIETLSGISMDDVKVKYNSPKPAQLAAHAYAQGTQIHLAPGQEKHLPHEAWHVVQQKQGRVKATTQMKGAQINDSPALEREADIMGAKATGKSGELEKPMQLRLDQRGGVAQLKKSIAMAYARKHSLSGIVFSSVGIQHYVDNKANPKEHRLGLLHAWNKGLSSNLVTMPADLAPVSKAYVPTEDLGGWDSGDEDDWKMGDMTTKFTKGKHELERGDGTVHSNVPEMNFFDSIKFGRQVVKRDDYKQIPIITDIGGHKIEFVNPGTKDIYATPLKKTGRSQKGSKKDRYIRRGTSRDYNWKNLAKNLEKLKFADKLKMQRQLFRFFLRKGKMDEMYPEVTEALAAMGSDLMKGSKGGRFFMRLALSKVKSSKKALSFVNLFSGDSPVYKPAAVGGRALVTQQNQQIVIDANRLLGINNCLINAISRAATGHLPTLGQIVHVREHFQNYGQMMLANGNTLPVIRQALGIQNPIQINYDHSTLAPPEDFPGVGNVLVIYHTGGNHFQENPPRGGGKKKGKK